MGASLTVRRGDHSHYLFAKSILEVNNFQNGIKIIDIVAEKEGDSRRYPGGPRLSRDNIDDIKIALVNAAKELKIDCSIVSKPFGNWTMHDELV